MLRREAVYIWYYFTVQFEQIFYYWIIGMAATIGVPLYACGGGTIPLLQQWLADGMSMASASAFMITGPATKITNLGALKIILGIKHFIFYILFIIIYSLLNGFIVNLFL